MAEQEFIVGQEVPFSELPLDSLEYRIVFFVDSPPSYCKSNYFVKVKGREAQEVFLKETKTIGKRWHKGFWLICPEPEDKFKILAIQTLSEVIS